MASFFLEIGIIIFLAFIGAYLAGRAKLSAIVGYIIVGILIGPYMALHFFGLDYHGLITDTEFVQQISKLGLMFLLFFTGLGFSATALKSTWKPAILLAVSDVLINLYIGFIIGSLFGWPLADTLFLAAIVGMSSVAVAAKSAEEGKQLYRKEYNYLFSTMIVEDFISILLLTFASAFVLGNALRPEQMLNMGVGVVIIYSFFFVLALYIAPKAFHYFERIQGNELFVLFALSVVFLSSAFADFLGIPPAIGAFLVGMAFAETTLKDKLEKQMLSMKDAFVAIFFVSFGMLVNPGKFWDILPMVALAVPLVMMNEVFILAGIAYLVGFTRRAAVSIGAGFLGRSEDAVLFASVGAGLSDPETGRPILARASEIGPFAGIFCFAMCILTPLMMRVSVKVADAAGRILPDSAKFGGNLVSRVLRSTIMASGFAPSSSEKRLLAAMLAYGALIIVTLMTPDPVHLVVAAASLALLMPIWWGLSAYIAPRAEAIDLQDLDVLRPDQAAVRRFVTNSVMLILAMMFVTSTFWVYGWQAAVVINLMLIALLFISMRHIFQKLKVRAPPMSKEHILPTGKPLPVREPLEFEPRKERIRVQQPVRKPAEARTYRPVPKELLLPGSPPRR